MGEAKRRKKLDPNFGKTSSFNKLPDFGYWWYSNNWKKGEFSILTIASFSKISIDFQEQPPSLDFRMRSADGKLLKGYANFPSSEMAYNFFDAVNLIPFSEEERGINVFMTLEPDDTYISSEGKQIYPLTIYNFKYDSDIGNPKNALQLLETINLTNKRVFTIVAE